MHPARPKGKRKHVGRGFSPDALEILNGSQSMGLKPSHMFISPLHVLLVQIQTSSLPVGSAEDGLELKGRRSLHRP